MKRCLRWACMGALLIALAMGILYEASTHVVRGWLRGEAFYDGRPTSYWREQVDGWVSRFGSLEQAETHLRQSSPISSTLPAPPRPTLWARMCLSVNLHALRNDVEIPHILVADNRAEPVWREMEAVGTFGNLIDQARRESGMWGVFRRGN